MEVLKLLLSCILINLLCSCGGDNGSLSSQAQFKKLTISGAPQAEVSEDTAYNFKPSVVKIDNSKVDFSIINKPSWAVFSADTGLLSGTPGDSDVGEYSNITIQAKQAGQTATLIPFNISVVAVNDTPSIEPKKVTIQYDEEYKGTIPVSDPDSSHFSFILVENTSKGTLTLNTTTGDFFYNPPGNVIAIDSFVVKVSDGQAESKEVTIELNLIDMSAPGIVKTTPMDGAQRITIDTELSIVFDDAMQPNSFTFTSGNTCNGSIQLSFDNFQSCISITDVSIVERKALISLNDALSKKTDYKLRLSSDIKNIAGLPLSQKEVYFKTARSLVITEVSASIDTDAMAWFEVYNDYPEPVSLKDYQLKSNSSDFNTYSVVGTKTFSLPDVLIQPGAYLIISAQSKYDSHTDTENKVHIQDGNIIPYWSANGFIEIVDVSNNLTEDFLRFGTNTQPPTTTDAWKGASVAAMPVVPQPYGYVYSRNLQLDDTDTRNDWNVLRHATPGFANDIRCNTDSDLDGIPDCTEVPGSTYAGMPLYDWGARVGQKDIFIEIDSMISTDEGVRPRKEALQMVVKAFALKGYAVHFDVGDMFDGAAGTNAANFDLGGGNDVPFSDGLGMNGWTGGVVSLFEYKANYFDFKRKQIFHYMLFGGSQKADGSSGSTGYAEILGNDSFISLGGWGLHSGDTRNLNALINFQSGTIMHELGHNLGLRHGGDNNVNNKPNYYSTMNYLYQIRGLATIGNQEGDRYHRRFFRNTTCEVPLFQSYFDDYNLFKLDYSDGSGADLDESAVLESAGLGRAGSTAVDYNCNGTIDGGAYSLDINQDGVTGVLKDFDDWGAIELVFSRYWNGNNEGMDSFKSRKLLNDDFQETIKELEPSKEFFHNLKLKTARTIGDY